jgi:pimeloyl-ACP methyl ester carboxylesterase
MMDSQIALAGGAALAWCVERFGADGEIFLEAPFESPEPDLPVLADPHFGEALAEALRQGVAGYAQDMYVQGRPWPFDPGRIRAPVVVAHGGLDTVVPIAHSRHTAERIPAAMFRPLPAHGHLTILSELPAIVSELARSTG